MANLPIYNRYGVTYPTFKRGKRSFWIEYSQTKRRYLVFENGKEICRTKQSNEALITVLKRITPYSGDDWSDKPPEPYTKTLALLEKIFYLPFVELVEDEQVSVDIIRRRSGEYEYRFVRNAVR